MERTATPDEMALATRIVHAVRSHTTAGAPLVGQVDLAIAVGVGGSARRQRRRISQVIWLCHKIAPILYPGMVFNRNGRLVYTVGVPTVWEQLQMAYTRLHLIHTNLLVIRDGLLVNGSVDVESTLAVVNSVIGVISANEALLGNILARHMPR